MIPKKFRKIVLDKTDKNKDIEDYIKSLYMCEIYGSWYSGQFSKQWYGLNFSNWGTSGIKLSSINSVYEIVFE